MVDPDDSPAPSACDSSLLARDLEATLDASELGIWAWNMAETELHFSRRGAELLGATDTARLTFERCLACVVPDDRESVARQVEEILASPADRFAMHYRIRSGDQVRHVESRGRIERDEQGRPTHLFGLLVDVTERAAEREELEKSREQYRLFTELASDYVYLADLRHPKLAPEIVAGSFERTTGYTPDEITELGGWFEVIHEADRSKLAGLFDILRAGRPFTNDYRIRTKFGEERWVRDHVEPILEQGELIGIMGGVQDITEKKVLEEQLAHAQKLEALARLSGSVAHDFNNLLTVMFSAVARLEKSADDRRALGDLNHAIARAAELSASLLAFARKRPTVPEVVALDEMLARLVPIALHALGGRIELEPCFDATGARVLVDPSQLELAVLNLLVNASDALGGRGQIRIASSIVDLAQGERRRPPELEPGRYAAIDVVDRGPGIPHDVVGRIFEPFFTTKPLGQGTGLGLSTVHGVLRQFGGTVVVESVVGRGSVFTLYLPLSDEAPRPPAELHERHAVGGSETIWIVEDEPLVRQMVARVLGDVGYRVRAFGSSEELLEAPDEELATVDLLVTDIRLPGLAGTDLALGVVARHPAIRVVLMSGLVDEPRQLSVVSSGRFVLLQKPFSPDGLVECVRRSLEATGPVP